MARNQIMVLVLTLIILPLETAKSDPALGIKEVLESALKESKALEILRTERDIALGMKATAENARLPRVELGSVLSAGVGEGRTEQAIGHSTSLRILSKILDSGAMGGALREAELNVGIKDLEFKMATERVLFEVIDAFGQLQLLHSSLSFEKESHRQLKEQALIIEQAYKQGLKRQADFVNVELDLRTSEVRLARLESEIALKKAELSELAGFTFDQNVTFTLDSDFKPIMENAPSPRPWSELESEIPELNLAQAKRELENSRSQLLQAKKYPDVALQASAGVNNELLGADFLEDRSNLVSAEVSLHFDYPLWDWGQRNREITAALSQKRIAEISYEETLSKLRLAYERLLTERKASEAQLQLAKKIMLRATQSYNLSKDSYRRGLLTYLELADSHSRLFQAKQSLLRQESALQKNIYEVLKFRGKLYETWFP